MPCRHGNERKIYWYNNNVSSRIRLLLGFILMPNFCFYSLFKVAFKTSISSLGYKTQNCVSKCHLGESVILGVKTNTTICCSNDLCNHSMNTSASKQMLFSFFLALLINLSMNGV
jgi:hypothetical protein